VSKAEKKQLRFDERITDLIPHRSPMLLINYLDSLNSKTSSAIVLIDEQTPFFEKNNGVPSWIGLEYMGQTAALIAGHQALSGALEKHVGFLIGSRNYDVTQDYFALGGTLRVSCKQVAIVGESLVSFDCTITKLSNNKIVATGSLSVYRQPL
jgi:predicted hotdog family 3-hydroxylacyl-ACP dehydratase